MTCLRTQRLILRRARIDDVDDLHEVLGDPAAMTYWSSPPHSSRSETEAWVASMIASSPQESDDFVVELDGKVIGKFGAWRLPEFGFILAPAHQGRGFASEAMTAYLPHVFARPDVDRLRADVDPRNLNSLRLLQRHGFVRTGFARNTWHTHIGACDSVYLELERARSQTLASSSEARS